MEDEKVDDGMKPTIVGHILIRDVDSGQVLLKQRDNLVQQARIAQMQKINNTEHK